MPFTHDERYALMRAAMLNTEALVFEASHTERLQALLTEWPLERIAQLQRDHQREWAQIARSVPTVQQMATLNVIISDLGGFSVLPAEDRNYMSVGRVLLYEGREHLVGVRFNEAQHCIFQAADKLHWVACDRKRDHTRAHHRMPDPNILAKLDRIAQRCYGFCESLRPAIKVAS